MKKAVLCAAVLGLVSAGMAGHAFAAGDDDDNQDMEKCYGIALPGNNDCKAADNAHDCSMRSTRNKSPYDFRYIGKGECKFHGGSLTPPGGK